MTSGPPVKLSPAWFDAIAANSRAVEDTAIGGIAAEENVDIVLFNIPQSLSLSRLNGLIVDLPDDSLDRGKLDGEDDTVVSLNPSTSTQGPLLLGSSEGSVSLLRIPKTYVVSANVHASPLDEDPVNESYLGALEAPPRPGNGHNQTLHSKSMKPITSKKRKREQKGKKKSKPDKASLKDLRSEH